VGPSTVALGGGKAVAATDSNGGRRARERCRDWLLHPVLPPAPAGVLAAAVDPLRLGRWTRAVASVLLPPFQLLRRGGDEETDAPRGGKKSRSLSSPSMVEAATSSTVEATWRLLLLHLGWALRQPPGQARGGGTRRRFRVWQRRV
jgi:hypothetical protein